MCKTQVKDFGQGTRWLPLLSLDQNRKCFFSIFPSPYWSYQVPAVILGNIKYIILCGIISLEVEIGSFSKHLSCEPVLWWSSVSCYLFEFLKREVHKKYDIELLRSGKTHSHKSRRPSRLEQLQESSLQHGSSLWLRRWRPENLISKFNSFQL